MELERGSSEGEEVRASEVEKQGDRICVSWKERFGQTGSKGWGRGEEGVRRGTVGEMNQWQQGVMTGLYKDVIMKPLFSCANLKKFKRKNKNYQKTSFPPQSSPKSNQKSLALLISKVLHQRQALSPAPWSPLGHMRSRRCSACYGYLFFGDAGITAWILVEGTALLTQREPWMWFQKGSDH